MDKIVLFFKSRSYGFYVTLLVCVLSLVTVCIYASGFSGTKYMSWASFVLVIVGIAATLLLSIFKLEKWAPAVILLMTFISMLTFVYAIYLYVVTSVYAASVISFSAEFSATVIFYIISIVTGIANVFFKQSKEVK